MTKSAIAMMERKEREALLTEERRANAKAESEAVRTGVAETVSLDEARGETFRHPVQRRGEAKAKPIRRLVGLDLLFHKGRLDQILFDAGERYSKHYEIAYSGVTPQSCLNVGPGGGSMAPSEALVYATAKLQEARREALRNVPWMITACDTVCGQGIAPSKATANQREAERMEDFLLIALELLSRHYGLRS